MEEAFDVDVGHAATVNLIEARIRLLEGDRRRIGWTDAGYVPAHS